MRQQYERGASGDSSLGASETTGGPDGLVPGKRTLVERTYGHGLSPVQQRPASGAAPSGPIGAAAVEAADAGDTERTFARVTELVQAPVSAVALRSTLVADPALMQAVVAYLQAGGDSRLNDLMAAAFPAPLEPAVATDAADHPDVAEGDGLSSVHGAEKSEKQPTDPTQLLPAARSGHKTLAKGTMQWTLRAVSHQTANAAVDFEPDTTKTEAKNISFVQTVISKVGNRFAYGGGTATDPAKDKNVYRPFEDTNSKKRVDHLPSRENDPFYGAQWDQTERRWKQERAIWKIGTAPKEGDSASASLTDAPSAPESRMGLGDTASEFETVPVVLETREPLGALTWGYKINDHMNSRIELMGGTDADCTDAPSADWGNTLDRFYSGKFETILDDFVVDEADLTAAHTAKLEGVITKMKADALLKAQLGGACDLTEQDGEVLSHQRAENVRNYLTGRGIAAGRIEVQSYGSDWARVEAQRTVAEGKNRRVQIWLHK